VKSAADGIRELGNKSAGAFSETAFGKYPSLQKDRDREQREEVQQDEQQDDEQRMKRKATENATWEDVRKAKEANDKQEAYGESFNARVFGFADIAAVSCRLSSPACPPVSSTLLLP
jgi:hypothetical protein